MLACMHACMSYHDISLRRQTVPIFAAQVACLPDVVDEFVVNPSASIRIFFRETYNARTCQKTTIAPPEGLKFHFDS